MSDEGDRDAAEIWSRGPEREVRWLPPTADRTPPAAQGPRYEASGDSLRVLYWAFAVIALATLAGIVSDVLAVGHYQRLLDGEDLSGAARDANDLRTDIVSAVESLATIAAAFAFIAWFHAAYRNAGALGAQRRYGEGWAIGAWFVPILNLWRPKQIANDLWAAGERGGDPREPPVLLLWWWLAWLVGGQSGLGFGGLGADPTNLQQRDFAYLGIGLGVISVAGAALACVAATRIQRRLEARAAAETA